MNYLEFYTNSDRHISETLLSMWAYGQERNQKYFKQLLKEEPLLAEPVFQATFPWEVSAKSFGELTDIFDPNFIESLDSIKDSDYRFPIDRYPYLHQTSSWEELLNNKKSIVVTSGTGSGKTECFMMPVLQDLLRQKKAGNQTGVQAIFLYPLNALMNSQQKRMKAWCQAVNPQLTFAIYNGNTPENVKQPQSNLAYPEIISRKGIRATPPQILFTNPTMLEYMLVRKSDQDILTQSQGKLRWILLDETHIYSGSAAAELSMQIRRILDAFGVTADQVRFAATSATIGSDNETQLKQFIAQLTGKQENEIIVINGKRVLSQIIDPTKTNEIIDSLRWDLNTHPVLSATEIGRRFDPNASIEESLRIIDSLSEKLPGLIQTNREDAILPSRAHFFIRSIGGVFVCTNPQCTRHQETRPSIGSFTTHIKTKCDCCGSPLLELTSCPSCGNYLLVAEKEQGNYPAKFRLPSKTEDELFELIENEDPDTEDSDQEGVYGWRKIVFAKGVTNPPSKSSDLIPFGIDNNDGTIIPDGDFVECEHNITKNILCPHCGQRTDKINYFRTSTTFLSRILSVSLLEQAEPMKDELVGRLWGGRKYMSFTDNRQGTAKSALAQNTEVERNWIRTAVFHLLSNKKREGVDISNELTAAEQLDYAELQPLRGRGRFIDNRLQELEDKMAGTRIIPNPSISLNELCGHLDTDANLMSLYRHISGNGHGQNQYLRALLFDQFGRRPRKGNSPETMGLVKLAYPWLQKCECPIVFTQLGWTVEDWRSFLKICIDFFIRENTHIIIPNEIRPFITQDYYSNHLYAPDCQLRDERTEMRVKHWPSLDIDTQLPFERQNRLILLLCAAMDITDVSLLDATNRDKINSILVQAWRQITANILSQTDQQNIDYIGYKLDLFEGEKVKLELIEKAWFCPVTSVPMDTIFRGYSPTIKGNINRENFARYKVVEELGYPYFPYANKLKKEIDYTLSPVIDEEILSWKNENLEKQKELGLWSNLHERILLYYPIFLAAEHSAQQSKSKLQEIEEQFNSGRINILSCSTTMEMGVDIGGISEVVMNNVPPKPANYLQRAGRAGRRDESKSLTVTFCAPNPIGTNVMKNPKWAMIHKTAMPIVKLESGNIIQRHINSFLLATFVSKIEGANVKSTVGDFFYRDLTEINNFNYELFRAHLNELLVEDNEYIRNRYKRIVFNTIKDSISFEQSIEACLSSLEGVYERFNQRKKLLDTSEDSLIRQNGYNDNSPEIKAIGFQRKQLLNQNLLGFLAEQDFIPSAGIPTGIVDFNIRVFDDQGNETNRTENNFGKNNPSLQITRALAEYAPKNQVVINERCYDSSGIIMKSEWNDSRRAILQSCPACGYSGLGNILLNECPDCHHQIMNGIQSVDTRYTEVIEPAGFSVDYFSQPKRIIKNRNGQQSIIEPILLNMVPWNNEEDGDYSKIEIRTSSTGSEILYYNIGNGFGYAICIHCGRAVPENGANDGSNPMPGHKRLNGGKNENDNSECSGNENYANGIRPNVLLGGRLQTDFVELRFRDEFNNLINDAETIWSLGVILSRKLAEYLGINDEEISFGIKRYPSYSSIFIFDTAKGGAGYSTLFINYSEDILDSSYFALNECNCEKACTSCLIDRNSQWHLNNLDRNKAIRWLELEREFRSEVPEALLAILPGTKRVTSNLLSEVTQVLSNTEIQKVTFYVSNIVAEWNPENWKLNEFVKRLKLQGKEINFAMYKPNITNLSAREIASVIEVKGLHNYKIITNVRPDGFCSLMHVEYANGEPRHYFTEQDGTEFSENWGTCNGSLFKCRFSPNYSYIPWDIDLISLLNEDKMVFEFKIKERNTSLFNFYNTILLSETEKWNKIIPKLRNKKVKVTYLDIYLKDPLGCLMLLNLIKSFSDELNLDIQSLQFNLSIYNNGLRYDTNSISIDKDWGDSGLRTSFLKHSSESILGILPFVKEDRFLPHWRELVFTADEFELIIRPNGGIKNGWKLDVSEDCVCQDDLDYSEDIKLYNQSQRDGILYNIVFENMKH